MKIFERITFPSSAVYNIQTEIKIKVTASATVELIKAPANQHIDHNSLDYCNDPSNQRHKPDDVDLLH